MNPNQNTPTPQEDNAPTSTAPWPEPVPGDLLLNELAALLKRYVVLPNWAPETLALWVLHTYAHELREVSSYLGIESPEKRCGKTTLLTVLGELVNRPVVAANISPPAFFRVIEQTRPTLLIDEADTFLRGNDELRGILNSGYSRKTAFVWRVVTDRAQDTERKSRSPESGAADLGSTPKAVKFSCWCPKVMAAIGRLPDTLADRCIIIRMQRKLADEECDRLRDLDAAPLRRQCARFVLDHATDIAAARPEFPQGLNDRAADIWEPLLALADLAGGEWPALARQAALSLSACANESNPTAALLLDFFVVFAMNKWDRAFTRSVVHGFNTMFQARPWHEALKGKPVTDIWLARQLRPYGIKPKTIWIGEHHAKGYELADLRETLRRYVPKSEVEDFKKSLRPSPEQPPAASTLP